MDERQGGNTAKGTCGTGGEEGSGNREEEEGREVEGKTDGGVRGRLGYLQITSLCDRFMWRLNWARGLRGNQSKS